MSKLILLKQIEACREEMISLYSDHELTSDTMIITSKKLDELIIQYQHYDELELQSI